MQVKFDFEKFQENFSKKRDKNGGGSQNILKIGGGKVEEKFVQTAGIFQKIDLATLAGAGWKNRSRSRIFGVRSTPRSGSTNWSALRFGQTLIST